MSDDKQALRDSTSRFPTPRTAATRPGSPRSWHPDWRFSARIPARTIDDQVAYLQKVSSGGPRVTQSIDPIEIHGDRAIVKCMVSIGEEKLHNVRLFIRCDGEWKLLAWANERL